MTTSSASMLLPCDGCGLPATQEHIGARIRRLELATQYRPIHIGILFVALAPPPRPEGDFYAPAQSREFSDSFRERRFHYGNRNAKARRIPAKRLLSIVPLGMPTPFGIGRSRNDSSAGFR